MKNRGLKVWRLETPVLHIDLAAYTCNAFLNWWVFDVIFYATQLSQDFKVSNGGPINKKIPVKTSSNHRLGSAGLKALEELLFKMLGVEKMVRRALFWKRDRKLVLLSILTKFGQFCQVSWLNFQGEGAGRGGMFICSKLKQNLSEMEVRTL